MSNSKCQVMSPQKPLLFELGSRIMESALAEGIRRTPPSSSSSSSSSHVQSPCIMKALTPRGNASGDTILNLHEAMSENFQSLNLISDVTSPVDCRSLLLLDGDEKLCVQSVEKFLEKLGLTANQKVKVVTIFGNTGEGKSHTLNETFFNGEEVFRTSSAQSSCTLGVWAMYDPRLNVICLDTEGLLGVSKKEQQRTRLLLKVLAVSDVIIYRTRAERLQRDMYTFLGSASQAYREHFSAALRRIMQRGGECDRPGGAGAAAAAAGSWGPAVIIFHETKYTHTLHESATVSESSEDMVRACFAQLQLTVDAFSSVKYVGVRTSNGDTSYKELRVAVERELESTEVRSARPARFIYLTLRALNEKYQTHLSCTTPQLYLPAFFTCQERCLSCKSGCNLSMGHKDENLPHSCDGPCIYQHQYQNCVYLCKTCLSHGSRIQVDQTYTEHSLSGILNYMWAGYSITCPRCGLLYRSRQHWYGNKNPEECVMRQEIVHIWPGDKGLFGTQNSAQRVLDGVTMLSEAVSNVTSQPVKYVGDWMAGQVAPTYWRPNHEITKCFRCGSTFAPAAKKHHCRACGEGFCDGCSSKRQAVPQRGWPYEVRVCDDCYRAEPPSLPPTGAVAAAADSNEVRARIFGETVVSSLSAVRSVLEIPRGIIKDTARPAYWVPDAECLRCAVCGAPFGPAQPLHHCRECGKGVCDDCSTSRKPVPARGWDKPVRVCDKCG